MAKNKSEKRRLKRKARQKQQRRKKDRSLRNEKLELLIECADWHQRSEPKTAIQYLKKALRISPRDPELLRNMVNLAVRTHDLELSYQSYNTLYEMGEITDREKLSYCVALVETQRYEEAVEIADTLLAGLPKIKVPQKRQFKSDLIYFRDLAAAQIARKKIMAGVDRMEPQARETSPGPVPDRVETDSAPREPVLQPDPPKPEPELPPITVDIRVDTSEFEAALEAGRLSSPDIYQLALDAYGIRLNETFDHLVCLAGMEGVRSLWYQEETARKVLKRFRGRALLSDEVGLGKTVEALMIFSEYLQRGMIKNGLILTPTPLVSQWRDEMQSKFGFCFPTTDDTDYKSGSKSFWKAPFILASINQVKSKKNFNLATAREYDIVIVDEAHHLKNRNTLNWKLVNALKKKYLLLLTATPVENNLMELYNLITLLKPGQLETATAFREKYMTAGDPTDPQNREQLKSLLNEVMIRNTRAVAKIDIPPRFAHTIRVDETNKEKELYDRVSGLVRDMNATDGKKRRLLLKNLLAEAGSSPRAVSLTLDRQLEKRSMLLAHEKEIRAIRNLSRTMDDTRKNRMLHKIIEANPGKFIVFVKYIGTQEHVSEFLEWKGISHALFHGSMSNREKDNQIRRFRDEVDVMVTTEIGGEGRNLQFCHQMINYDLPWNPMKIEQRIGRIHRIGQEKEVAIYNFCNAGSLEDYILEILDKKINMFEMVIGEIDMILGRVRGEQDFSDLVYDIWVNSETEGDRNDGFNKLSSRLKRVRTGYLKTKELDDKLFEDEYEL